MFAKSFDVDDLVWAKMKGYSYWPGKIVVPPAETKSPKVKKAQHYVYFYGSENNAWIADENIILHNEQLVEKFAGKTKSGTFLSAIDTIVQLAEGDPKYQKQIESNFEKISSKESKSKSPHTNSVARKENRKVPVAKFSEESKKVARKRAPSTDPDEPDDIACGINPPKVAKPNDYSFLFDNLPPNNGICPERACDECVSETVDETASVLSHVERVQTPPITFNIEEKLAQKSNMAKKIGFLGLGKLGQGMVKNLIESDHSVTIWNRTSEKCIEFIKHGAVKVATPSDVIIACDITFCCVSDSEVAKELVFGNCGVLKGLESSKSEKKGYVEMTALDPKTSEAISQEITLNGGRYLEAPLSGSRVQAVEGKLFILAAGDPTLFDECKSCFHAMGEKAMFIGNKIGVASQFNIVHNMLLGTVYAALAESMSLIDRVGLRKSDFVDILQYGVLRGSVVIEKANAMINRKYTSNTPLKHMQRGINLGLILGSLCEQPMPVTAAANEVYKHCKRLRYEDHDVSAVYEGTRR